jgi:hypothetical protein
LPEQVHSRDGRKPNRLADSASPYLLQHAHNPVDWYPWGPEALERARREDKPILLSIGYSACHWCHVMARESFEEPGIARLMNEHFVCIKVDREERPDLDELYVRAVQLLTGRSGWPLTAFLTPQLVPFHGGTYWPPEDRGGMPGFPRVLRAVTEAYEQRRADVNAAARGVRSALEEASGPGGVGELPADGLFEDTVRALSGQFDLEEGGFGTAPKFPQAPVLDFLLRLWSRSGDDRPLLMLELTLRKMADGGIRDHVGGGFHRYGVDRYWRVPHFEKMLYDNAQLMALFADAFRATGNAGYLQAARSTADYLIREMRSPEGGFYSAQDADSDGVEGKHYVWTYDEMRDCLGEQDCEVVARYFGAEREGNWEGGQNILYRSVSLKGLAGLFGLDPVEAAAIVERGVEKLLARRRERVPPATDDKVLTDWNALTASGLVSLCRATGDEVYLRAAEGCADFILSALLRGDGLRHCLHGGRAEVPAFLSDYAMLCACLLDLYESTFEAGRLRQARELAAVMEDEYWDEQAATFNETGRRNERLVAPLRHTADQPLPSGASVACHVLLRLAALGEGERERGRAQRLLVSSAAALREAPFTTAHMLAAALRWLSEPQELVIVGLGEGGRRLLRVADEFYLPHLVRAGAAPDRVRELAAETPLLEGRQAVGGSATAYLCSRGTCQEPVQEPSLLRGQLARLAPAHLEPSGGVCG